jgi:hypothetical protein
MQRAGVARCEINALGRDSELSRYGGMRPTLPWKLHANASKPRNLRNYTLSEQVLKAFMHKPFVEWVCVDHGILVSHVLISSRWLLQLLSMCVDYMTGKLGPRHI